MMITGGNSKGGVSCDGPLKAVYHTSISGAVRLGVTSGEVTLPRTGVMTVQVMTTGWEGDNEVAVNDVDPREDLQRPQAITVQSGGIARKLPHVVATAVANWHEVAVDFDLTFANIDNFLAAARRSGAIGLMNTVWLDSSYSPLRMARPAMAYGAAAPWQSSE